MITVLMPTYKQSSFIVRAVKSLLAQSFVDWELVIINDGSPDNTRKLVGPFLRDGRIRYFEHTKNEGLGYCLNRGFDCAAFDLIAYLPSDDIYYTDHLQGLYQLLMGHGDAVMAYSDVEREEYRIRTADTGDFDDENRIQLVQMLHRRTGDRWVERAELVSDNYGRLFLEKLEKRGRFITHDQKTCEWIDHPYQRTKIIGEKFGGGLNKYKAFYHIREPLKFQSSSGPYIDEHKRYRSFQSRLGKKSENNGRGLKILLVGNYPIIRNGYALLRKRTYLKWPVDDGQIFSNQESKEWFDRILPETDLPFFILDGELPARHWFRGERSPLLSDSDNEVHTVLAGRPIGLGPDDVMRLAEMQIHLHFYGEAPQHLLKKYIKDLLPAARGYLHLHPNCEQEDWVREFSRYDAGWLHLFDSRNDGDIVKMRWSDLNYPARLSTYAAAGVPTIQKDNSGHRVAVQLLAKKLDSGIYFKKLEELGEKLRDKARMKELRDNAWNSRALFQFDSYVDELIRFFEKAIR